MTIYVKYLESNMVKVDCPFNLPLIKGFYSPSGNADKIQYGTVKRNRKKFELGLLNLAVLAKPNTNRIMIERIISKGITADKWI